jgi:hypothetical protein
MKKRPFSRKPAGNAHRTADIVRTEQKEGSHAWSPGKSMAAEAPRRGGDRIAGIGKPGSQRLQ